jgi:hypothetical protein
MGGSLSTRAPHAHVQSAQATDSAPPVTMPPLQRKLAVGASHDPLERAADRLAEHLVGAAAHRGAREDVEDRFAAPASVDQVLARRTAGRRPADCAAR